MHSGPLIVLMPQGLAPDILGDRQSTIREYY